MREKNQAPEKGNNGLVDCFTFSFPNLHNHQKAPAGPRAILAPIYPIIHSSLPI